MQEQEGFWERVALENSFSEVDVNESTTLEQRTDAPVQVDNHNNQGSDKYEQVKACICFFSYYLKKVYNFNC